ncbi:hypothetical protein ACGFH8_05955 [Micromonospora sp. NPDC049175]|uniref:hypothetical protein n=1 Tax=Micromonospora sp. NPDC049175 TaxID=3364266 RepID=UPI00371D4C0A
MSLRAARLLVWPFAVAAFALRVCAELWFKPLTWQIDPKGVAFLTWVVVLSGTLLVPWVGYRLLTRSYRRPATWQADAERNRFVAPASPKWMGPWAMVLGWVAAAFVQTERIAGEDRAQLVQIPGVLALAIAVPAVVLGGIALTLLLNRPRLTLNPDGITAQGLVSRTFLPWDRLVPGGPPPPPRKAATIPLLRVHPVQGKPPYPYPLAAGRLHVDPGFLANTIRQYVEHPEHRTAIGTPGELDRLHAALT